MSNTELSIRALFEGATIAVPLIVIAFLLSRFTRYIYGRSLFVIFLAIAAGAYFGFAILGREFQIVSGYWVLGELAPAIIFGTICLLGLRGSSYWVAAGWALHAFWDFLLHYIGSGYSFAPWTYAIACVSFDWMVAVYIVIAYGLVGSSRLGFREVAT
jgi:hypothetical protein